MSDTPRVVLKRVWPPEPTVCRILPGGVHADNGQGRCWACGTRLPEIEPT